ncbi:hypothetical protein KAFR_0F02950 [Kazachstania africana CBS 2517]|uniref:Uncharacterized protein n=1 Tax=Kazachstania africana (strain ATCC 22294 / BCRC 22015 / CBS 2517 / CECT 1963 / NBRC 1671 / NRRL Y-8276) TaxID=1071382 RepID=H2AWZ1_KAZAF|nr:hypothetical protein KAFR_0F02950 [Kazachstania africana CBS 2517]CCF58891.1 hypothetical protein KAFR_0F02950 [Kazachstania africana CBS 2517]
MDNLMNPSTHATSTPTLPQILHISKSPVVHDIELSKVLENAKDLMRKLLSSEGMMSPAEDHEFINKGTSNVNGDAYQHNLPPSNDSNNNYRGGLLTSTNFVSNNKIQKEEIVTTMDSLMRSIDFQLKQIQQLKFKNMMLSTNNIDAQSRLTVEENLQKHEHERLKSQLLSEKQTLMEQLKVSDNKVKKYKKRIVDKNREINRLLKLLRQNSVDVSQIEGISFDSSTSSVRINTSESISRNKKSNMLRTLGVLATQVLNDNTEDTSANQTILQPIGKGDDETEAEISFYTNNTENYPNTNNNVLTSLPNLPEVKISSPNNAPNPIVLPKMRSFSTVDGSVKDR